VAIEFRPAGKSDRAAIMELFEVAFKAPASAGLLDRRAVFTSDAARVATRGS